MANTYCNLAWEIPKISASVLCRKIVQWLWQENGNWGDFCSSCPACSVEGMQCLPSLRKHWGRERFVVKIQGHLKQKHALGPQMITLDEMVFFPRARYAYSEVKRGSRRHRFVHLISSCSIPRYIRYTTTEESATHQLG